MPTWPAHPAAVDLDPLARISADSAGLADAATGNLGAPVEYCPGWSVADLVWHVRGVHHFWGEIVEHRMDDPTGVVRLERPAQDALIEQFRVGARRLVSILAATDPAAPVWTWAPQHDAAFVIRHQVQEAAVHRWDAEHAAGRTFAIDLPAAIDSIEEFLSYSTDVSDAMPLGAPILVEATDADAAWTVDDAAGGAVGWRRGQLAAPAATLRGSAGDLLLWLYGRIPDKTTAIGDMPLLGRFRSHFGTA